MVGREGSVAVGSFRALPLLNFVVFYNQFHLFPSLLGEPGTLMRTHSEWCLTVYEMFVLCIYWVKCFSAFLDHLAKLACF